MTRESPCRSGNGIELPPQSVLVLTRRSTIQYIYRYLYRTAGALSKIGSGYISYNSDDNPQIFRTGRQRAAFVVRSCRIEKILEFQYRSLCENGLYMRIESIRKVGFTYFPTYFPKSRLTYFSGKVSTVFASGI